MTTDSPTSSGPDDQTLEVCPVCGHLDSAHDVIGRRWCAVSANAAANRGCICSRAVQPTRVLGQYGR